MQRNILLLAAATALGAAAVAPQEAHAQEGNRRAVRPFGTDVYRPFLRAGDVATVLIEGNRTTNLDLYVASPGGELVAHDDDPRLDACVAQFRAREDGPYTVEVRNLGAASNVYSIVIDRAGPVPSYPAPGVVDPVPDPEAPRFPDLGEALAPLLPPHPGSYDAPAPPAPTWTPEGPASPF